MGSGLGARVEIRILSYSEMLKEFGQALWVWYHLTRKDESWESVFGFEIALRAGNWENGG